VKVTAQLDIINKQYMVLNYTPVMLCSRPGLGLEDPRGHLMKVSALALPKPRPRLFPQDPAGHVVAVRERSAHTHNVT